MIPELILPTTGQSAGYRTISRQDGDLHIDASHDPAALVGLLNVDADVNAQGGLYSNVLYMASEEGHEKVV